MPATPADIAAYTADGVVITSPASPAASAAIRVADPTARDLGESEIPMFFDNISDAQALLDEKFAFVSKIAPIHEGIEVEESLGLGRAVSILPSVPKFRVIDASRSIDLVATMRAYSFNMGSGRFSVEVLG
jgi:hypothetical protein